MITKNEVMDIFLHACPLFKKYWFSQHINDIWDRSSETILYTDFSFLARHVMNSFLNNTVEDLPTIFNIVENLLIDGDEFVKEATVVGLLEDIQNLVLSNGNELNLFLMYFGTETLKQWNELIIYWEETPKP